MTTTQHLTIFVCAIIVGVLAIRLWPLRQADRARRQQEKARAAAREALITRRGTTFHNGALAAIDGAEHWDNPHSTPGGSPEQFHDWDAGWCHGKQLMKFALGGQP